MMTTEEIQHNASCFQKQMAHVLNFEGENAAIIENNASWLHSLNFLEFMRDIGSLFSVNRMLAAECYKQRMERGLTFFEMGYMLMQRATILRWHPEIRLRAGNGRRRPVEQHPQRRRPYKAQRWRLRSR